MIKRSQWSLLPPELCRTKQDTFYPLTSFAVKGELIPDRAEDTEKLVDVLQVNVLSGQK